MTSKKQSFETMLTGGHPNSLGRTIEVVNIILNDTQRFDELYNCYFSQDPVVRLRTSNAMKRICAEHPDWLIPYLDKFISDISNLNQASTQWTLAQLFDSLENYMNPSQKQKALEVLKRNLEQNQDWIVQNQTMQTLANWAKTDGHLKEWLRPHLDSLATNKRKSVAGRAKKLKAALYKQ